MNTNRIIEELFEEGFNDDTIRAAYLIPVIDTAWADGKVQQEERQEILRLVQERGISSRSEAYQLIDSWLQRKPVDEFFGKANDLLEPLFKDLKQNRGGDIVWIIQAAERVASATGNPRSPISPGERKVLNGIIDRLKSIDR